MSELKESIVEFINTIPASKVVNYGFVAEAVGTNARAVGWCLSGMAQGEWEDLPWWRVVAKDGFISALKVGMGEKGLLQKELLREENIEINQDRVNMAKHMWSGADGVF